MSSLETIPLEVILDNLLMDMPIQSVVRLGCTNKAGYGKPQLSPN
jgi:hypothetical protein